MGEGGGSAENVKAQPCYPPVSWLELREDWPNYIFPVIVISSRVITSNRWGGGALFQINFIRFHHITFKHWKCRKSLRNLEQLDFHKKLIVEKGFLNFKLFFEASVDLNLNSSLLQHGFEILSCLCWQHLYFLTWCLETELTDGSL